MKILFCLLFPLFFSAQHHELIDWTPDYRLIWDDFKAKPELNSPNAALTSTAIKFSFSYGNGSLKFHINCEFDKDLSWGKVKNDYILAHEQGHFDIAEINARKFFKAVSAYKVESTSTISRDLNNIYQDNMKDLRDMQTRYDEETDNSRNPEKQKEWLKKIRDELKRLEAYAEYH